MSKDGLCISWQQHSGAVCAGLQELQQRSEFVDMTLAADGHFVRVHQLVIGLASTYLKELIRSVSTPHPVILLNNVSHKVLCCILEYIYTGEVVVPADELRNFIQVGKTLHVKGLEDMLIHEETTATEQDNICAPASSTISVNPEQQNIVIKMKDVPESPKSKKRKNEFDTILSPPKRRSAPFEIVNDNYDLDDTMQDSQNDIDSNADESFSDNIVETITDSMTSNNMKPEISYCLSQKGSLQLILNRYMYNQHHVLKDGKRRWRCIENRTNSIKCQAHVTTSATQIVARVNAHNHPVHDAKIAKKVRNKGVYASLESAAQSQLPDEDQDFSDVKYEDSI